MKRPEPEPRPALIVELDVSAIANPSPSPSNGSNHHHQDVSPRWDRLDSESPEKVALGPVTRRDDMRSDVYGLLPGRRDRKSQLLWDHRTCTRRNSRDVESLLTSQPLPPN